MANLTDNIVELWGMSENGTSNRVGTKGLYDLTPSATIANVSALQGNGWDRVNTHTYMSISNTPINTLLTSDEIAVTMFIYPTAGTNPIAFGFGTSTTNRFEGQWRNSTTDNTCTLGAQTASTNGNIIATFGPALNEWCMMTWWSYGFQQGIVMHSASRTTNSVSAFSAYKTSLVSQTGINTRFGAPVSGSGTWTGKIDQTILWSKVPDMAFLNWLWNAAQGRTESAVNTGLTVVTTPTQIALPVQSIKVVEPVLGREFAPILSTGQAWPLHQ